MALCSPFHLLLAVNMSCFVAKQFSPASTLITSPWKSCVGFTAVHSPQQKQTGKWAEDPVWLLSLMPSQDYHRTSLSLVFFRSCSSYKWSGCWKTLCRYVCHLWMLVLLDRALHVLKSCEYERSWVVRKEGKWKLELELSSLELPYSLSLASVAGQVFLILMSLSEVASHIWELAKTTNVTNSIRNQFLWYRFLHRMIFFLVEEWWTFPTKNSPWISSQSHCWVPLSGQ